MRYSGIGDTSVGKAFASAVWLWFIPALERINVVAGGNCQGQ